MKEINKLTVKYNNEIVGYLSKVDDKIVFQYDLQWQKIGFSISPISLPLNNNIYISKKDYFEGTFGVFYDSLPDGFGRLIVSKKLRQQGIDYEKLPILNKLSLTNNDSLGGLSYEPCQKQLDINQKQDLDNLSKIINNILNNSTDDLDLIYRFSGSSGGARPKTHLLIDNEEWIVKFRHSLDPIDIGKQEYQANELAKKCGINVAENRLFPSKICSGYFGSKRFDRINGKRIHVISLSSLLETTHTIPNLDYMHLFQVIQRICVDSNDLIEAYRRMTFNVLYGNKDDHGKNFSFIYDNGYHLSPFYDITSTPLKLEHEMTVLGNPNPTISDLLEIGKQIKLNKNECIEIIDKIKGTLSI